MPVYNSPRARFFRSFNALVEQTYGDFELILSDNGSGEEAQAVYAEAAALDRRVRLIRHAQNYGATLNFGYAFFQARGDYFMWSCDDDVRDRDYLRRTVERFDRSPQAVSVGTGVVLVDDDGKRLEAVRFDPRFALPRPSQRVPFHGPLTAGDYMDIYALHRRTALARTHLNQSIHGADGLMVRELLLQGPIERVDEELFFYRKPTSYNMASLAAAMMGGSGKRMLFRYAQQHLALQLLVSVATNDVPIDERERMVCLVKLAASLVHHGWLTQERYHDLRLQSEAAWRAGDRTRAAVAMAKALALAPIDSGSFRRLAEKIARRR
jgi:glycosyltransferase involved in cell wall biosynthesis